MGLTIAFTGHRPNKLWGYGLSHPKYKILYKKIYDFLLEKQPDHCISGMALGVDTISAIATIRYKVTNNENCILECAIPCLEHEKRWNKKDQNLYYKILKQADIITYVTWDYYYLELMQKRNVYMINRLPNKNDILLAVWNRSRGGTANCIKYAKSKNKNIEYIDPRNI